MADYSFFVYAKIVINQKAFVFNCLIVNIRNIGNNKREVTVLLSRNVNFEHIFEHKDNAGIVFMLKNRITFSQFYGNWENEWGLS